MVQKQRRTQAQRREETQSKVLACARQQFGEKGYSTAALEDIAREAGTTIRPIYHYFGNKEALFEAVTESYEAELLATLQAPSENGGDAGLAESWQRFMALCDQPGFVQVVLLDAPHILGRERLRRSAVVLEAQRRLDEMWPERELSDSDRELYARMLLAALTEAALMRGERSDYDSSAALQPLLQALDNV
ncbi:TetR/AcrR family transcriptional regulator [Spongiibacter marinus]|uniref:TetR/AcrR family transcriptional regulator n=1 Tax=Spongiibacter marinus TaxID=354246 RepID=UPI003C31541B